MLLRLLQRELLQVLLPHLGLHQHLRLLLIAQRLGDDPSKAHPGDGEGNDRTPDRGGAAMPSRSSVFSRRSSRQLRDHRRATTSPAAPTDISPAPTRAKNHAFRSPHRIRTDRIAPTRIRSCFNHYTPSHPPSENQMPSMASAKPNHEGDGLSVKTASPKTRRTFRVLLTGPGFQYGSETVAEIALPLLVIAYFGADSLLVGGFLAVQQSAWLVLGLVAGSG